MKNWTYDPVDRRLVSLITVGNFLYTRDKMCAVGVLATIITMHKNVANQYPLWKVQIESKMLIELYFKIFLWNFAFI